MKKSCITGVFCAVMALFVVTTATAQKKAWAEVTKPEITKISLTDSHTVSVEFNLLTNDDGSDKGSIVMTGPNGSTTNTIGKTRREAKKSDFTLKASGTYSFVVYGERAGEATKIESAPKTFQYTLPLESPTLSLLNIGNSQIEAKWTAVKEAEGYILTYTDNGKKVSLPQTTELSAVITGLTANTYSDVTITAVRGKEQKVSAPSHKRVLADAERIWQFAEFGTSTGPNRNRVEVLDPNDLKVRLYSCLYDEATGNILEKGGKFESFFDGISFYYTVIDPEKENFELTATVHIDYHNPVPDGQEGFGVLALDKLGINGEAMVVAYSNSAGIISRKFTAHINGSKKEIKDGVGARFVTDITPEILAMGDTGISQYSSSVGYAYSYDQASDAVRTGSTYRVTLKKDNTGYHAIYKREVASEDAIEEYTLYDPENMKLRVLDRDHVYLGFAVARGVNATFSDVELKITDPKNDPPAEPEPPTLVPLNTVIQSPATWYNNNYPFVLTANSDGAVTVATSDGTVLIDHAAVKANVDFEKTIKIAKGVNNLLVTFDPEDGYEPKIEMPSDVNLGQVSKKTYAIAQYNTELLDYEVNYNAVTLSHAVTSMSFKGKELFVSPKGTIFGTGARDNPLDLQSAINYAAPGQTITLLEGPYNPTSPIMIERGNNGTKSKRKVLRAEPGTRAVINLNGFNTTASGLDVAGNYWTIQDIDLTKSTENSKAMQIRGSYNIIRRVDAYMNGDTGIQISGSSAEPYSKWPAYNLVEGCESFGNCDPAQNNADGFAAKLTSGDGNVFRNCIAHHNVDDGWDLYSKIETGPIGAVLIENCIAYSNGRKIDNTGKGDGNGFKMGGDGIGIKHILRNSISFNNDLNGITTNSNPALIIEKCTAFANKEANINLYGKGAADEFPRTHVAIGTLSLEGAGGRDKFDESKDPNLAQRLASDNNFFFNGAQSVNKSGAVLAKDALVNVDYAKWINGLNADGSFNRFPRNAKGQFELGDLFKLTSAVPAGVGADYNYVVHGGAPKDVSIVPLVLIIATILVAIAVIIAAVIIILKAKKK